MIADDDGNVTRATLVGLVAMLTDENQSSDFSGALKIAFLQMYRAVATPRVLLCLLRMRYYIPQLKSSSVEKLGSSHTPPVGSIILSFVAPLSLFLLCASFYSLLTPTTATHTQSAMSHNWLAPFGNALRRLCSTGLQSIGKISTATSSWCKR